METLTTETFYKELSALQEKYKGVCAIVAIPTNVLGKDNYWHPSAEVTIASVPAQGVESPLSNNGGIIQA